MTPVLMNAADEDFLLLGTLGVLDCLHLNKQCNIITTKK
jgi:hypothetical protein